MVEGDRIEGVDVVGDMTKSAEVTEGVSQHVAVDTFGGLQSLLELEDRDEMPTKNEIL